MPNNSLILRPSIALYYYSLEHSGGIERVVVEQSRIFSEKGFQCLLLTNEEPKFYAAHIRCEYKILPVIDRETRNDEWKRIIEEYRINFIIMNNASDIFVKQDIETIHNNGAKVINTIHFSFPSPVLFNEAWESFRINKEVGELCDAVATVSEIDAIWWRSLGCNAYHVQNPFKVYEHSETSANYLNHSIIWIGRGVEQKQPEEALFVLYHVIQIVPDAKLIMIGLEDGGKKYEGLIRQMGIEGNIEFILPTSEIGKYYQQSSVHLLTSITESFCLVIAEAKSYHIPTVMYDIPFLELIKDGKGVTIVSQRDAKSAADQIIKYFKNPDLLKKEGEDAYSTLSNFNDDTVVTCWQSIFDSLENEEHHATILNDQSEIIIREIYNAWMYHCTKNSWKIEFFDNIKRATGRSAKGFIAQLNCRIIEPLKTIKRKIRKI